MRRVGILAVVGAIVGTVMALLIHAVQSPTGACASAAQIATDTCKSPPALGGLLLGLAVTGLAIGALSGVAWNNEHKHRVS